MADPRPACGVTNGLDICRLPPGHEHHRDLSGTTWTAITGEQLAAELRGRILTALTDLAAEVTDDVLTATESPIGEWERRTTADTDRLRTLIAEVAALPEQPLRCRFPRLITGTITGGNAVPCGTCPPCLLRAAGDPRG